MKIVLFIIPVIGILLGTIPVTTIYAQSDNQQQQPTCSDGSQPDSNGNCPQTPYTNNNNGSTATTKVLNGLHDFGEGLTITTNVFHNEKGVFIPWTLLCKQGQEYLAESCSTLVDSNGTLTPSGDMVVNCIGYGLAATKLGLPFNSLTPTMSPILGCSELANQIQNSPDLQRLVQFAGTLAQ